MSNLFALYESPKREIAENEISDFLENVAVDLNKLLIKWKDIGATDTMSRDRREN